MGTGYIKNGKKEKNGFCASVCRKNMYHLITLPSITNLQNVSWMTLGMVTGLVSIVLPILGNREVSKGKSSVAKLSIINKLRSGPNGSCWLEGASCNRTSFVREAHATPLALLGRALSYPTQGWNTHIALHMDRLACLVNGFQQDLGAAW